MEFSPRKRLLSFSIALVALGLVLLPVHGHADPKAPTWSSWRGDASQTGVARGGVPDAPREAWSYRAGGPIRSSAVLNQHLVFFGSDDGSVHALDRHTGAIRWKGATEGPIEAPPTLIGDTLIVGSTDGAVHAFAAADGKRIWKLQTEGKIIGAASALPSSKGAPSRAVIGSYDGILRAFELQRGEVLWEYATGAQIHASPAVFDQGVLFGGCDGKLHLLDAATGKPKRTIPVESQMGASPAVFDGQTFVGHFGNAILMADVKKEGPGWTYRNRAFPYLSSPAVDAIHVIAGGRDRQVHCLDRKTGEERWVFPTRGKVDSSPVIAGNRVVVGSLDGRLRILQIEDGEPVWTEDLGAGILASPAVDGGWIFLGAMDGVFRAFAQKTGGAAR